MRSNMWVWEHQEGKHTLRDHIVLDCTCFSDEVGIVYTNILMNLFWIIEFIVFPLQDRIQSI